MPRRHGRINWIIKKYVYTPENKQQICRNEHDDKNAYSHITEAVDLIPPPEEMASPILRAHARGEVGLTAAQLAYLRGLWDGTES